MPKWHAEALPAYVIYPVQRRFPLRIRSFVDFAAKYMTAFCGAPIAIHEAVSKTATHKRQKYLQPDVVFSCGRLCFASSVFCFFQKWKLIHDFSEVPWNISLDEFSWEAGAAKMINKILKSSLFVVAIFALHSTGTAGDYVWARSQFSQGPNRPVSAMGNGYGGYYVPRNAYGNNFEGKRVTNPNGYIVPTQMTTAPQTTTLRRSNGR